jgi:hypothetical protein
MSSFPGERRAVKPSRRLRVTAIESREPELDADAAFA